jgi:predicted nucleic acid-binding protein
MPRYLLDTNVVSELIRRPIAPRVEQWMDGQADSDLYLASVTLGEMIRGAERLPEGRHRQTLENWLTNVVLPRFKGRVLAFDRETATIWGRILGEGDRQGRPRPIIDAQISATAIRHRLILATRNISDHGAMGAQVFNPWTGR